MAESNVAQQLTSEVLNTISKSQAAVVDAIETWACAVQSIKPDLPQVNVPFADKLPTPPRRRRERVRLRRATAGEPAEVRRGPAEGDRAAAGQRVRRRGQEGREGGQMNRCTVELPGSRRQQTC